MRQQLRVAVIAAMAVAWIALPGWTQEQATAVSPTVRIRGIAVDDEGKPVPRAEVWAYNQGGRDSVGVTDPSGHFDFTFPSRRLDGIFLRATVPGLSRQGTFGYRYLLTEAQSKQPARIVLKPARTFAVHVVDPAGKPIAGATVGLIANHDPIARGHSDGEGRWLVRAPADTTQECAFAFKAEHGFDYAVSYQPRTGDDGVTRGLPEQITLTLDGARAVQLKAVDRVGGPIAGVRVAPYAIQKPGHEPFNNWLERTWQLWPATGSDGMITLDWLPSRFDGAMCLAEYADGLRAVEPTWISSGEASGLVTVLMLPIEIISGRVTHADGRPAVDVLIWAQGQGTRMAGFADLVRTDAAGRYEIRADSGKAYIVAVKNVEWAAPYRADIILRPGKPAVGIDFVLCRSTRLHGRVTSGKENKPLFNNAIMLVIDKGEVPAELQQGNGRTHEHVRWVHTAETDEDGEYQFRLGPGEFLIERPGGPEPIKLTVPAENMPVEITRDIHVPGP